jgi:hypothetical protein
MPFAGTCVVGGLGAMMELVHLVEGVSGQLVNMPVGGQIIIGLLALLILWAFLSLIVRD